MSSLPEKIQGAWIWSEIIPALVPEINFDDLLILGTIVKHKELTEKYQSLRASLRKIQWTKVEGMRPIAIESVDVVEIPQPNLTEKGMAFFKTHVTENMKVKQIRMSNLNISSHYKRLSDIFKEREIAETRIDGSHFDFLTTLSFGLWEYVCHHFGKAVAMPNIRVVFVTEQEFSKLLLSNNIAEKSTNFFSFLH